MIFPCDSLVISFSVINYVVSLASRVNVASRRKMKKDTLPGVLFYINATNIDIIAIDIIDIIAIFGW